jgi:thiosulfate dehydrogenase
VAICFAACGDEQISSVELGASLVKDPAFSSSPFNAFACTDCHAIESEDPRLLSGATLRGAAVRPTYWNGFETELLGAVNDCVIFFMKGDPIDPLSDNARALYDYLDSIKDAGPQDAQPFTVVLTTTLAPARGDVTRGAEVHRLACQGCHGEATSGAGRIEQAAAPILPEQAKAEALAAFPDFDPAVVFTEKVRHGQFFIVGGNMPPFSIEALSDADLGALLAFYGL